MKAAHISEIITICCYNSDKQLSSVQKCVLFIMCSLHNVHEINMYVMSVCQPTI
jgi:hypothetical protein